MCLAEYVTNVSVLRFVCRHGFHIECWHDYLLRGRGRVIARWRYIAPPVVVYQPPAEEEVAEADQHVPVRSSPQAATAPDATDALSRASSWHSIGSQFVAPWWPPGPLQTYHAATQLASGEVSVLVDPGAWTNLIGGKLAKKLAQLAVNAGFKPRQWKMKQPLQVAGVGNGHQTAEWCVHFPIAILDQDGETATQHAYESPVIEGLGDELPGLSGLKSMKSKRSVLEMTDGKEVLSFPGPGGYEIKGAPGTVEVPLKTAPSGHLLFVVDAFGKSSPPCV